jgi:hypothetical protein
MLLFLKGIPKLRRNVKGGMGFTFLLDPGGGGFESLFLQNVHHRARHFAKEFNIASVKDASARGRLFFEVPMSRHIIEIRLFIIIQGPDQRILIGMQFVIAIIFVLSCYDVMLDVTNKYKCPE